MFMQDLETTAERIDQASLAKNLRDTGIAALSCHLACLLGIELT